MGVPGRRVQVLLVLHKAAEDTKGGDSNVNLQVSSP